MAQQRPRAREPGNTGVMSIDGRRNADAYTDSRPDTRHASVQRRATARNSSNEGGKPVHAADVQEHSRHKRHEALPVNDGQEMHVHGTKGIPSSRCRANTETRRRTRRRPDIATPVAWRRKAATYP